MGRTCALVLSPHQPAGARSRGTPHLAAARPRPRQAEKFRAQAQKSDTWRLPQQYCRYLFYLGCIR